MFGLPILGGRTTVLSSLDPTGVPHGVIIIKRELLDLRGKKALLSTKLVNSQESNITSP